MSRNNGGRRFNVGDGDVPPYKLTDAELERLACLMEECAEVQQIVGKIIRHGYESYNPFDPHRTSNRKLLERELGDLIAVVNIVINGGDINGLDLKKAAKDKKVRIRRYLHYNQINIKYGTKRKS